MLRKHRFKPAWDNHPDSTRGPTDLGSAGELVLTTLFGDYAGEMRKVGTEHPSTRRTLVSTSQSRISFPLLKIPRLVWTFSAPSSCIPSRSALNERRTPGFIQKFQFSDFEESS